MAYYLRRGLIQMHVVPNRSNNLILTPNSVCVCDIKQLQVKITTRSQRGTDGVLITLRDDFGGY